MSNQDFYPGKRLCTKGNLCTVRYVGEVRGKPGRWLGVEWDDATRGKHSGTHEGVKYFECRSPHPTAGSFIRPTATWDKPRSFLGALKEKYAPSETVSKDSSGSGPALGHAGRVIFFNSKPAEEIGFEKIEKQQAELQNLRIVILDDMFVGGSGEPEPHQSIADTCPNVTQLDLSRNLFETLGEITSICEQLLKLRSLTIDGNRLRNHSGSDERTIPTDDHQSSLERIQSLSVNDLALQPQQLEDLLSRFPAVRELSASGNRISTMDANWLLESITSATLEKNEYVSLQAVLPPSNSSSNLRSLNLKNNRIASVASRSKEVDQSDTETQAVFQHTFHAFTGVTELDVSYNNISSWQFLNDLRHAFPSLIHLRISHNPLFETLRAADSRPLTSADGYMLTIARLPNLQTLNHSTITAKERLNAETYYLSQIAQEISLAPAEEEAAIVARHPRYRDLCEEYGSPHIERAGESKVDPNSLAARLVACTFRRTVPGQPAQGDDCFAVELPKSLSIYSVLGIVGKHYGVLPLMLKLVWETGEKDPVSRSTTGGVQGVRDWDSEDEEGDSTGQEWMEREVELVAGTRPLGTIVEVSEASIRVEYGSDAVMTMQQNDGA